VRLLELPVEPIHGILAAPPCTVFANSGARWSRSDDEMREGLSVVDACCRLILAAQPEWWCLENPHGILSRYLGPPTATFQPNDYGADYTKFTCLWGRFTMPDKAPVPATARKSIEFGTAGYAQRLERRSRTTGFESSCGHDDGTGRSIVLDPFAGSGTTGAVAVSLGREFVGIELNPTYAALARRRCQVTAPLFA
jgi:hypothetical protein